MWAIFWALPGHLEIEAGHPVRTGRSGNKDPAASAGRPDDPALSLDDPGV
jgi:hypothetical protein